MALAANEFEFQGDPALRPAIEEALGRVIDPEMGVSIASLGLVYGVEVAGPRVRVRMTMTSAACPVAGLIIDEVHREIDAALGLEAEVELVWDPPWGPERMSAAARAALAWDD